MFENERDFSECRERERELFALLMPNSLRFCFNFDSLEISIVFRMPLTLRNKTMDYLLDKNWWVERMHTVAKYAKVEMKLSRFRTSYMFCIFVEYSCGTGYTIRSCRTSARHFNVKMHYYAKLQNRIYVPSNESSEKKTRKITKWMNAENSKGMTSEWARATATECLCIHVMNV